MKKVLFAVLAIIIAAVLARYSSGFSAWFSDTEYSSRNLLMAGTRETPRVHVSKPNGGEYIIIGKVEQIRWEAKDPEHKPLKITIELSSNGGENWELLARNLDNTGRFSWLVDVPPGQNYRLRITAISPEDPWKVEGSDTSDGTFKIYEHQEKH
jgi:hypothetical protein